MPRPINFRFVGRIPACSYYKPQGVPLRVLEQVNLTVDEIEAIRLVDMEGMYQAQAAQKMNISRQTLGRIIESAHKKIADALVNGKALSIEGGTFKLTRATEAGQGPPWGHRGRGGGRGRGRGRGCM
jgi:predicted DNA-binding protein (UPF0251 family)